MKSLLVRRLVDRRPAALLCTTPKIDRPLKVMLPLLVMAVPPAIAPVLVMPPALLFRPELMLAPALAVKA